MAGKSRTTMLLAYCDASTRDKVAAATTIIMTDETYVTHFTNTYSVKSSTQAELLSVLQTVRYIKENCSGVHRVALFNDNLAVVKLYITALSIWDVPDNCDDPEIVGELLEYSKDFNISVQHIHGHQRTHNPNKVCDMLSHLMLEVQDK